MSDDDIGTVRWFGETWNAPVNDPRTHIDAPVGRECERCRRPIHPKDQGVTIPTHDQRVVYHRNCFFAEMGISPWVPPRTFAPVTDPVQEEEFYGYR